MQKYQNNVQTLDGRAIVGASVTVTEYPGGAPATVYNANGSGVITQPVITNGDGEFAFYAANGRYQLSITGGGISVAQNIQDIILFDPADGGAVDAASINFQQTGTGTVPITLQTQLGAELNAAQFGAKGDNSTDDTAAIIAAIAEHKASGRPLVFNAGVFKVSGQIAIDVSSLLTNTGINIRGAGRRRTIFSSSYGGGVPFLVTGGAAFFHSLRDIGFQGTNNAGAILQIGKDDFSDAFNSCTFTGININNSSLNASCEGVRLNYVLQSDIDIVSNCGGTGRPGQPTTPGFGSAVVLRQVQFSRLKMAAGNANIGMYVTSGFTFGNSILALDIEEVDTGVKVDSANAASNRCLGGTIVATKIFDSTAGQGFVCSSTNLSPYGGGSFFNGTNNTGIVIDRPQSALAVNTVQAENSLPGNAANLRTFGPDANIFVNVYSKGNGNIDFYNDAGNQLYSIRYTATAANFHRTIPNTAGNPPTLDAVGSDTNIDNVSRTKGTGSWKATNTGGNTLLVAGGGTSIVNFPQVQAAAAGSAVQYQALGNDTNIDLQLTPKGTGNVRYGTFTGNADAPITGYVTIKDAAGNVRKLAVIA